MEYGNAIYRRRGKVVAFFYAFWLAGMMLVQFLMHGGVQSIVIGVGLLAVPLALHVFLLGVGRANSLGILYFSIFGAIVFISLMTARHEVTGEAWSQVFGLFVMLGVGYLMSSFQSEHLLERIFLYFSPLLVGVLFLVFLDGDYYGNRLFGRLHPNLWSVVAFAGIPGALMIKNTWLKAGLIAFITYMVAIAFQSRGALIALISIIAVFYLVSASSDIRRFLSVRNVVLLLLASVIGFALVFSFRAFLAQDVFDLWSSTRGLATGFSGRFALWKRLFDLAAENPFTGLGFRLHIFYIDETYLSSAHNAYLAMLLDLGVFGAMLYIVVILHAFWRSVVILKNPAIAAFIAGYALAGLTEARALNIGNSASLLFIFSLMFALSASPARVFRPLRRQQASVALPSVDPVHQ